LGKGEKPLFYELEQKRNIIDSIEHAEDRAEKISKEQ
jgi:hypothetical protein